MEKILGILRFALAREIEGMEFYRSKLEKVKSQDVKEVFQSLANMESGHIEFIRNLMDKIGKDESIVIDSELLKSEFFEEREKTELPSKTVDELANDLSVLRMAYLIEKDFEEFYRNSAERVEDADMKKILTVLADWEKGHKELLLSTYDENMKSYWDKMGFSPLY